MGAVAAGHLHATARYGIGHPSEEIASGPRSNARSGKASLAMGLMAITEGAIPFAAADPIRVIPCIMGGSAGGSVIAMLGGVGDHAPHGGPIVLPVVDHRLMYVIAICARHYCDRPRQSTC